MLSHKTMNRGRQNDVRRDVGQHKKNSLVAGRMTCMDVSGNTQKNENSIVAGKMKRVEVSGNAYKAALQLSHQNIRGSKAVTSSTTG